jgi:hypothetical protein
VEITALPLHGNLIHEILAGHDARERPGSERKD